MKLECLYGPILERDPSGAYLRKAHAFIPDYDMQSARIEPIYDILGKEMKDRCKFISENYYYILAMSSEAAEEMRRIHVKGFTTKNKRK